MKQGNVLAVVLLAVLVIGGLGIVGYFALKTKSVTPTSIPTQTTSLSPSPTVNNTDIPPLYPGVEWGEIKEGKLVFIGKNGEIIERKGYHRETTPLPAEEVKKFTIFYSNNLLSLDWIEVDYASGPEGETLSYFKNGQHFTVGYKRISETQFYGFIEYD
jgi:hypothetical protein